MIVNDHPIFNLERRIELNAYCYLKYLAKPFSIPYFRPRKVMVGAVSVTSINYQKSFGIVELLIRE
jgi:hypothetical protein